MLAYIASGKEPEDSERLRKRIREGRNKRKNRTWGHWGKWRGYRSKVDRKLLLLWQWRRKDRRNRIWFLFFLRRKSKILYEEKQQRKEKSLSNKLQRQLGFNLWIQLSWRIQLFSKKIAGLKEKKYTLMKKTVPASEYSPETLHNRRAEANMWEFTKWNLQWKCLTLSMCLNLCWIKARHSLTTSSAHKKGKQPIKPKIERTCKWTHWYSCFSNTGIHCFDHSGLRN